jgi:hypothetical protein
MKPDLKLVETLKSESDDEIVAWIRPLGREVTPSAAFLRRTRSRLLLLGSGPTKRSQAA